MYRLPLWTLLVFNVFLILFGIPYLFLFSTPRAGHAVDVSYLEGVSFAVVPLVDIHGDGANGQTMTNILFTELEKLKVVDLVSPLRLRDALTRQGASPGTSPSHDQLLAAARQVRTDILVTGTLNNWVMLSDRTSAISISLLALNAHTGKTVWSDTLTKSFENTAFADEGARLAATIIVKRMAEEMESHRTAMRRPPNAQQATVGPTAVPVATQQASSSVDALMNQMLATKKPPKAPTIPTVVAQPTMPPTPSPTIVAVAPTSVPTPPPTRPVHPAPTVPPSKAATTNSIPTNSAKTLSGSVELARVCFDTSTSRLASEPKNILEKVIERARADSGSPIIIEGHTDNTGADRLNSNLALARAEAVKRHLVSAGIRANRIVTIGYGDRVAVASNDTEDGRQRNRRAAILLVSEADRVGCSPTKTVRNHRSWPKQRTSNNSSKPSKKQDAAKHFKEARSRLAALRKRRACRSTVEPDPSDLPVALSTDHVDKTCVHMSPTEGANEVYRERSDALFTALTHQFIQPGDALRIKVAGHDELNKKVIVSPRGTLSYNLIDDFQATGKSLKALTATLQKKISKYIINASVTVRRLHLIKVLGDAGKQGTFEFDFPPSILELLASVGGLAKADDKYNGLVARIIGPDGDTFELNVTAVLKNGAHAQDLHFYHGDTIIIEPEDRQRIYVIGAMKNAILYRTGMRLLDALILADAGMGDAGTGMGMANEPFVNLKNVRILRKNAAGRIDRIEINLHDILHRGKTDRNIPLCAGDYIVVPRRSKRRTVLSTIREALEPITRINVLQRLFD